MGAPEGNANAKKDATRVSVCLSIADDKEKMRRSWAVQQLQRQGIADPTYQQINRFVKDWCYARIDEAMQQEIKRVANERT